MTCHRLATLLILAAAVRPAAAHMLFVVPQPGDKAADVFVSEDLTPDAKVPAALAAKAQLSFTTAAGVDTPLATSPGKAALTAALPATVGVVHGTLDLGVTQRGEAQPYRLIYHPRTIVGDAFAAATPVQASHDAPATPIEIAPAGDATSFRFVVTVAGRPAPAGTEMHVIRPDASQEVFDTDAAGHTEAFTAPGRYGAWAKTTDATPGTLGGKPFVETRHYATLVFDVGPSTATNVAAPPATQPLAAVRTLAPLPEAVSSFGAVVAGGALYVYGGHTAVTHSYDTSAVSKRFHRLDLSNPSAQWEELPGGPGIQGMNLAAHDGKIYRVGGMEPRNKPGTEADNFSLARAAVFDPKVGQWTDLPPLPKGRSSHDVIVVGDTLYVVGGWTMNGVAGENEWPGTMLAMDLNSAAPAWREIAQPFKRRALITAAAGGKIYVFGGFTEDSDPSKQVDVYDTKTGTWSTAPGLPGEDLNGFAPAAVARGDELFVSVGDGSLYRLDGTAWTKVAQTTPRIVHRLAVHGDEILVIGGAAKGKNFDLIEAVNLAPVIATR